MYLARVSPVRISIVSVALAAAFPAGAQLQNLDEQLKTTQIRPEKIAENFYVLFGVGGNIVVSIGETGTLIVDAQFPRWCQGTRRRSASSAAARSIS